MKLQDIRNSLNKIAAEPLIKLEQASYRVHRRLNQELKKPRNPYALDWQKQERDEPDLSSLIADLHEQEKSTLAQLSSFKNIPDSSNPGLTNDYRERLVNQVVVNGEAYAKVINHIENVSGYLEGKNQNIDTIIERFKQNLPPILSKLSNIWLDCNNPRENMFSLFEHINKMIRYEQMPETLFTNKQIKKSKKAIETALKNRPSSSDAEKISKKQETASSLNSLFKLTKSIANTKLFQNDSRLNGLIIKMHEYCSTLYDVNRTIAITASEQAKNFQSKFQ